jgi:hypothetical protein
MFPHVPFLIAMILSKVLGFSMILLVLGVLLSLHITVFRVHLLDQAP